MPTARRAGVAKKILDQKKPDDCDNDAVINLRQTEIDRTRGGEHQAKIVSHHEYANRRNYHAIDRGETLAGARLRYHQNGGEELKPHPTAEASQHMGNSRSRLPPDLIGFGESPERGHGKYRDRKQPDALRPPIEQGKCYQNQKCGAAESKAYL